MNSRLSIRRHSIQDPEIRKAGRLGNDRPSLGARLGVGLSKPWGVWEGGFDERLGEPPAGYVHLSGVGRAVGVGSAANLVKTLSDMNYK